MIFDISTPRSAGNLTQIISNYKSDHTNPEWEVFCSSTIADLIFIKTAQTD